MYWTLIGRFHTFSADHIRLYKSVIETSEQCIIQANVSSTWGISHTGQSHVVFLIAGDQLLIFPKMYTIGEFPNERNVYLYKLLRNFGTYYQALVCGLTDSYLLELNGI